MWVEQLHGKEIAAGWHLLSRSLVAWPSSRHRVTFSQVTEDFYVVLYGNETAQFGMMRRKAELLKEALQEPLSKLSAKK